jgi:hypothetical protein
MDVAEKSGFAGGSGFDLPKRRICTTMSNPTVAMSPIQNHGPVQRGCVWSNRNSASAIATAVSGMIEASV